MKNELMGTENNEQREENITTPVKNDHEAAKLLVAIFGVTFLVILIVAAVIVIRNAQGKIGNNWGGTGSGEVTQTPEDLLQEQIQSLGLMETACYYYTHVTTQSESKDLFGITIPGSEKAYVVTAEGKITAGVDFSGTTVTYDEENAEFTINVPKVKVLSNNFDDTSWQYFDEKQNKFVPLKTEDMGEAYADIMHDAELNATDKGLLNDAQKMAETILKNYLEGNTTVGDNKITIVFGAK